MFDYIKELLDLEEDDNIQITNFHMEGNKKIVSLEYSLTRFFCPDCGAVMHCKEKYLRKIKHSIFQDGTILYLYYTQRSWNCSVCNKRYTPSVKFVQKHKQNSLATTLLPVLALATLSKSVASTAKDFHISDTTLHYNFMKHVDMQRLPLPKILCIDEVYTNFRKDCKYTLVLMDFETREIIDLVVSRREIHTNEYFLNIPLEERNKVKYIVCDMYDPYLKYQDRYFHHAVTIIDSFHVVSNLMQKLNTYIRLIRKRYNEDSDEYYLLKKHNWVLLKNECSIVEIIAPKHIDRHFGYHVTTARYRELYFGIDKNLKILHELKEEYIDFNQSHYKDSQEREKAFDELIRLYKNSNQSLFIEFASLLVRHKEMILNSFVVLEKEDKTIRLSNGPMESFNRKPKDLKRLARGVENFEFFKQRVLFSERSEKTLLASPKRTEEIYNHTNKKRGPYKKKNKK